MPSSTDPGRTNPSATLSFAVAAAGATATPRSDPAQSQDWWSVARRAPSPGTADGGAPGPAHCGVVVCDGIGSLPGSRAAAEVAADVAARWLAARGPATPPGDVVAEAHARIQKLPGEHGGTTLVAATADETGCAAWFAVGNGAIIEMTAVPVGGGRWTARWVNHLLPQVDEAERLTGHLTVGQRTPSHAAGTLTTPAQVPRVLLVCSDGITSREHAGWGADPDGDVWEPVDPPLVAVIRALASRWDELLLDPSEERDGTGRIDGLLAGVLRDALAGLTADGRLDDDATVAALALLPRHLGRQ